MQLMSSTCHSKIWNKLQERKVIYLININNDQSEILFNVNKKKMLWDECEMRGRKRERIVEDLIAIMGCNYS